MSAGQWAITGSCRKPGIGAAKFQGKKRSALIPARCQTATAPIICDQCAVKYMMQAVRKERFGITAKTKWGQ
jgi:hypothetical protein